MHVGCMSPSCNYTRAHTTQEDVVIIPQRDDFMANFGDGLQVDTGVQKILIVITVLPRSLPPSAHARSQVEENENSTGVSGSTNRATVRWEEGEVIQLLTNVYRVCRYLAGYILSYGYSIHNMEELSLISIHVIEGDIFTEMEHE